MQKLLKDWSFFKKKKIVFGQFAATQYIVFENKNLGSLLFFYFKGDGWQDRYHTHAFNAISFKFFGSYGERCLEFFPGTKSCRITESRRTEFFRYFPRDSYHCLGRSKGCLTMLMSGPWKRTWKEYRLHTGQEVELGWGRKEDQ